MCINEDDIRSYASKLLGKSFKFRPQQLEAVQAVIENAVSSKHTVLQAPTGSGKSIIGMLSAYILHEVFGMKSYILASDLSLFAQYEKDMKEISQKSGIGCFGWIKGKENYECHVNGCTASQSLCSLQGASVMAMMSGAKEFNRKFLCRGSCEYANDYFRAVNAPVALMTYQLYFIQRNYVEEGIFKGRNPNFPKRDLVICDECHNICDICQSHFAPKASISRPQWMDILDDFFGDVSDEPYRRSIVMKMMRCKDSEELVKLSCEYESYVGRYLSANESIRAQYAKKKHLTKLEKARLAAGNMARQEHCKLDDMLSFICSSGRLDAVVAAKSDDGVTLNFVYDSMMLKKYFHEKSGCELLMSATVGDFDDYARIIGLEKGSYMAKDIPSSFDFSKSPIYISSANKMSMQEKDASFSSIVKQVEGICMKHSMNRGIIQTGSYANADALKSMLPKDIKRRCLFYKGSKEKSLALKSFMAYGNDEHDNHILVGPTLIEGLDFKDNLCRFQICIKVPYAYLGNDYICKKKDCIKGWYVYDAVNKICQGIGRGVRHKDDWCETYILDGCVAELMWKLKSIKTLEGRFVDFEDGHSLCCSYVVEDDVPDDSISTLVF